MGKMSWGEGVGMKSVQLGVDVATLLESSKLSTLDL